MIVCQLVLPVLLVLVGVCILLIRPDTAQPSLVLSPTKYNTHLDPIYRNFVPFSTDGAAADSFAVRMQGRFNGDPEEGVYGVAVEVEVGVGAGGAGGVEGAVVEDEFGGCAQGADVLYDMSQYAILSADDPPQQEKGSSRYGVVTIARTTNASQLHYNVLLNASAVHAVGVYVNLVHQAFLQVLSVPTAKITTHSYPLPTTYREKNEAASASAFVTALFTLIAFCFIPAQMAVFVVREREVKAKHQQVISGVSIYAYWISTYLWDVLAYLPTAALVLLVLYIFDVKSFITGDAATATTGLLLLYGPATAALTYALSFLFVSHSTAQIAIMFFHFVTGLILSVVSFVLTSITSTAPAALSLRYLFRVFPSFCLGDGILLLALCVDDQCPQITSQGFGYEVTLKPLDWDIAGADMAFMGIHAVFYFALTVGIEYCLTFPSLLMWLYAVEEEEEEEGGEGGEGALLLDAGAGVGTGAVGAKEGVEGAEAGEDEDVLAERVRVLSGAADSEVVRIQQLRKVYPANSRAGGASLGVCFAALGRGLWRNICGAAGRAGAGAGAGAGGMGEGAGGVGGSGAGRRVEAKGPPRVKVAVRRLTFGIPKGECFGFLGINGAGKTTTLSILSGDFPPSSGEAYIDGFSIRSDQTNIRKRIGYCPQFDALLELLTVREHLELYGRVKGLTGAPLEARVRAKLVQLDLSDFEDKTAGALSGGNKRKLSVAVATIGEPSIVFLDEPSTGMDPVARRFMWGVVARMTSQESQCSVILTTHSMEEAEALCTRIGVMVDGRLQCLGSAQHLKARFGNGFEVNVKLLSATEEIFDAAVRRALPVLQHTRGGGGGDEGSGSGGVGCEGGGGGGEEQAGAGIQDLSTSLDLAPAGRVDAEAVKLTRHQLAPLCSCLGVCADLVTPYGSGAALHDAFLADSEISLRMLLDWALAEQAAQELDHFFVTHFGRRAQLVERSTAHSFRYRIRLDKDERGEEGRGLGPGQGQGEGQTQTQTQTQGGALSEVFSKFEAHKGHLRIKEYSVGQTTLEAIFNQFAGGAEN